MIKKLLEDSVTLKIYQNSTPEQRQIFKIIVLTLFLACFIIALWTRS